MNLKTGIEHVFSVVEYYIVIGIVLFIGKEADLPLLTVLASALGVLVGVYMVIPILSLLPNHEMKGAKLWLRFVLYVVAALAILSLSIFVLSSIQTAVSEGISP